MKLIKNTSKVEWWENHGGFFGSQYVLGDDSIEGYLPEKQESLEERTKREVNGIITILKPNERDMFLDVPCGYGRHSIELVKRGYRCSGIDINEEHLKKAEENAKTALGENTYYLRRRPVFYKGDMRNVSVEDSDGRKFTWVGHFDHVLNMFYSFGFFKSEDENFQTMESFYRVLKEGGDLLLHTDVSPEMISQGHYRMSETRNLRNGGRLYIAESYDPKTRRINGSWTIKNGDGTRKLTPYSMRIYTKEEFEEMAKKVGFKETKFYGFFNGECFTSNSSEMIMVARK